MKSAEPAEPSEPTTPQAERPKFDDLCDRCITATDCIVNGCCLAEARAVAPVETPQSYPCADCGVTRTEAEGGRIFTVCDECWDKRYANKAPVETRLTAEQMWPTWQPVKLGSQSEISVPRSVVFQFAEAFRDKSEVGLRNVLLSFVKKFRIKPTGGICQICRCQFKHAEDCLVRKAEQIL